MSQTSDYTYFDTVYFDITEFLNEYEKLPCLWDKGHAHFKDRRARLLAEEVLGEKLGILDLTTLRKKIRSVRGTYNTEVRKIKSSIDMGTELYIPKLSWFPLADKFLRVTTDVPTGIEIPIDYNEVPYTPKKMLQKLPRKDGVTVVMVRGTRDVGEEEGNYERSEDDACQDDIEMLDDNEYDGEIIDLDDENIADSNLKHATTDDSNEELLSFVEPNILLEQSDHQPSSPERKDLRPKKRPRSSLPHRLSRLHRHSRKPTIMDVVKSLKDICHASENEFAAFGRSVGVQLQNMPIELAIQLQTDIQAHITTTRLEYLRKQKDSGS